MSEAVEVKLHIKLNVNKKKTNVLFAEAGSDFTDMLLSFLLLPLGTIVQVLEEHYGDKAPVIGSLTTLYKGASNLDVIHFRQEDRKEELINSTLFETELRKLRLNIRGTQPTSSTSGKSYDGVFTDGAASFIISDDLYVFPNGPCPITETLTSLGIAVEDMDGMETRNVMFGRNEMIGLLRESLISSNPLTSFIFPSRRMPVATEGHVMLPHIKPRGSVSELDKMILKVMLQKSTNKLLFAQADADFVDFLLCMLCTSLGPVEWFLRGNTGLQNMDNLYMSVAYNFYNVPQQIFYTKELLMKPRPIECEYCNKTGYHLLMCCRYYVKGANMYMVSDDLTVSPLGLTSGLSVINELKISLSDTKEVELQIGLEEGLSLLQAALTSTTALTDGLIKPFLKKQEQLIN